MRKIIGSSYVKQGKRSLSLTADDLFDKIINLKFIRRDGTSFPVRSDYEAVHHKDGTISFKKCVQKPDIKITYKQVAQATAIEVDIEIVNFFAGDPGLFTNKDNPVEWCVIQMGYRAQFPDWSEKGKKEDISQFYDLNNNSITNEKEVRRGNQIQVNILTGYQKSYPPDSVTYFQGIVGTFEHGLRLNHTDANLVKGYGDNLPQGTSEIESVLFRFITQRFIRADVIHLVEVEQEHTNEDALKDEEDKSWEQVCKVYEYDKYADPSYEYGPNDIRWRVIGLDKETHAMTVEDAKLLGVRCFVSQSLRRIKPGATYSYTMKRSGVPREYAIPDTPFNALDDTVHGQLGLIQKQYPFLKWVQKMNGDYFFYHEDDTEGDIWEDPYIKQQQKSNLVFLPAIYDMAPSGTRTIRCPFISFLNPMQTVIFETRYLLGSLVSFFYTPTTNAFLVITSQVEFATVQDNNSMELMCVDAPPHTVEYDEDGMPKGYNELEDEEIKYNDDVEDWNKALEKRFQWWEEELTIVKHVTNNKELPSSWENITTETLLSADREAWEEGHPTEKEAFEAAIDWNSALNAQNMSLGNSIENTGNGIGARYGISVCWLKEGNKFKMRRPFLPSYPQKDKRED